MNFKSNRPCMIHEVEGLSPRSGRPEIAQHFRVTGKKMISSPQAGDRCLQNPGRSRGMLAFNPHTEAFSFFALAKLRAAPGRYRSRFRICLPFHGLRRLLMDAYPVMNRWAIYVGPVRGLNLIASKQD